jgi:mono/diheme cytochrome c family protein
MIYVDNCMACHGENGEGDPPVFPAHAGNPFVTADDPESAIRRVLLGRGGMPGFGIFLSDTDVAAALSYIRNAFGNDASVVRPDTVEDVRAVIDGEQEQALAEPESSPTSTAVPASATADVEPTATAEEPEPTATPGEQAPTEAALISAGEPLYAQNCAPCHGAEGGGGIGPTHAGNEFVLSDDPTEVIVTVLQGRGGMPSFADNLSNEQIAAVLSYLRNSLGNSAPVVSPEEVGMLR